MNKQRRDELTAEIERLTAELVRLKRLRGPHRFARAREIALREFEHDPIG